LLVLATPTMGPPEPNTCAPGWAEPGCAEEDEEDEEDEFDELSPEAPLPVACPF
jgi:hypothetical protein